MTRTIAIDTAIPSAAPIAAAPTLYAMPSDMYICSKCERFVPTARIIPISTFRSAASITKMRKISIMPAAIENSPSTTKSVVNTLATLAASSTASDFAVTARQLVPCSFSFSAFFTCFELSNPSRTPPVFETAIMSTSSRRNSS